MLKPRNSIACKKTLISRSNPPAQQISLLGTQNFEVSTCYRLQVYGRHNPSGQGVDIARPIELPNPTLPTLIPVGYGFTPQPRTGQGDSRGSTTSAPLEVVFGGRRPRLYRRAN